MFSLYILHLYFPCYCVFQTYIPFSANNLIVLMIIDKLSERFMIEKVFINQVEYSQKRRDIVLQFFECYILIQMVPFNGIMSISFD